MTLAFLLGLLPALLWLTIATPVYEASAEVTFTDRSVPLEVERAVASSPQVVARAAAQFGDEVDAASVQGRRHVDLDPTHPGLTIAFRSADAVSATTWANALATAYLEQRSVATEAGATDEQATVTEPTAGAFLAPATTPSSPVSPHPAMTVAFGLLGGLLLGLVAFVGHERRSRMLHDARSVRHAGGVPVAGSLPTIEPGEDVVTDAADISMLATTVRRLRARRTREGPILWVIVPAELGRPSGAGVVATWLARHHHVRLHTTRRPGGDAVRRPRTTLQLRPPGVEPGEPDFIIVDGTLARDLGDVADLAHLADLTVVTVEVGRTRRTDVHHTVATVDDPDREDVVLVLAPPAEQPASPPSEAAAAALANDDVLRSRAVGRRSVPVHGQPPAALTTAPGYGDTSDQGHADSALAHHPAAPDSGGAKATAPRRGLADAEQLPGVEGRGDGPDERADRSDGRHDVGDGQRAPGATDQLPRGTDEELLALLNSAFERTDR